MPAPKNNKYNERWTERKSIEFFKKSLELLKHDKSIVFIGSLAVAMDSYKEIYTYLTNKFGEKNKDFLTIKKEIDSIIESRLFSGALNNDLNSTVSIFGLKNNHGWKDKTESDVNMNTSVNIIDLGVGEKPKNDKTT